MLTQNTILTLAKTGKRSKTQYFKPKNIYGCCS